MPPLFTDPVTLDPQGNDKELIQAVGGCIDVSSAVHGITAEPHAGPRPEMALFSGTAESAGDTDQNGRDPARTMPGATSSSR